MHLRRTVAATAAAAATLATALFATSAEAAASAASGASSHDRVLVKFAPATSAASVAAAEHAVGASEVGQIADLGVHVLNVPAGAASAVVTALSHRGDVAYAEPDGTATTTDVTPNDPYFPTGQHALSGGEWGSTKTQAPAAWGITTGSPNVTIAVVDSGVAGNQPDLAGVLVPGHNVLTGTADTTDTFGHGTSVSGVAVASSNNAQGVAAYCWQCKLMPVKVSTAGTANYSDIASGITWAVDHGARVVNVSIAGTTSSSVLGSAVSYATSHNVLVVAAAGNNGSNAPMYPAATPGVLSVAATDQLDALTSYSEYGSWVDVAAPGSTVSTIYDGTYNAVGGTSIASPTIAGIAALLLSAAPNLTPSDVASALASTTDPISGTNSIASGRVNAYRALLAVGGSSTVTPAPPPAAPSLVSPPTVTGMAQSGQSLAASTGSWSNSPTSYVYQWQRCDTTGINCAGVVGATASTYALTSGDVGFTMRVVVTATNAVGSTAASSAATAVVAAGSATTTFSGSLTKNATSRSYSLTVGAGPSSAKVSFAKCSSLSLSVSTSTGTAVASASGPSVLSIATNLSAGGYIWTVSGSCRVSFTLNVTAAA